MTIATRTGMTLEEFLCLPEREPPLEYEEGEIAQKESPKLRHSIVERDLVRRLEDLLGPGYEVFPELRVTFGGRSVVPDLCVIRLDRLERGPDGGYADDVLLAPDAAIEIVSPKQPLLRLVRRCVWYAENGAAALLLDPSDRSALVFRPGQEPRSCRDTGTLDLTDAVPGLSIELAVVFAGVRP